MLLRSMGICSFICSVHDADADADDMVHHDELSDAANEICVMRMILMRNDY